MGRFRAATTRILTVDGILQKVQAHVSYSTPHDETLALRQRGGATAGSDLRGGATAGSDLSCSSDRLRSEKGMCLTLASDFTRSVGEKTFP